MPGRICILILSIAHFHFSQSQDSVIVRNLAGCKISLVNSASLGNQKHLAVTYPELNPKNALYRLDFWVTGLNTAGDTVAVVSDIYASNSSWKPGPAAISGLKRHPGIHEWPQFVVVSRDEILTHKSQYNKTGYVPPAGIVHWPGDYKLPGFPKVLAPYADYNQNQIYDFSGGDYPFVPGRDHIFTMAADSSAGMFPNAVSHRLDRSVLWFTHKEKDTAGNVLFFRMVLCNRDTTALHNVKLSAVADFSIGNPGDDFISTDVKYQTLYGYNNPGPDAQHGLNWPAVCVGWLSRKAVSSIYFENSSDKVKGKPISRGDYYQLSNGFWKTGKFLSFGSAGLDGSIPARYVYSNGSDENQGFKDWDEEAGTSGRRTALISTGGWTLNPGSCELADGYVMIVAGAPDSAKMKEELYNVSRIYKTSDWSVALQKINAVSGIRYFPNPVSNGQFLNISGTSADREVQIYSTTGKTVLCRKLISGTVKIELEPGTYFIKTGDREFRKLLVVP